MLFIVIHQVYELWFKQILHEVQACIEALEESQPIQFLRCLNRINTIQKVLIHQVDILETMTPHDFNLFRERLNPASGFQSAQFRVVEFQLGAKNHGYLKFHEHNPLNHKALKEALDAPTLYDHFFRYLRRKGYSIPDEVIDRDFSQIHESNKQVVDEFFKIYRSPKEHYDTYAALEAMVSLEQDFKLWRFRHVAMVERMIGTRMGTGGSAGAPYLKSTLSKQFFPEIWEVRNRFGAEY
jgi:tryptophan 2,3-dioxygenase